MVASRCCELALVPCIIKGTEPVARQVMRDRASDKRQVTAGAEHSRDDSRVLDKRQGDPFVQGHSFNTMVPIPLVKQYCFPAPLSFSVTLWVNCWLFLTLRVSASL